MNSGLEISHAKTSAYGTTSHVDDALKTQQPIQKMTPASQLSALRENNLEEQNNAFPQSFVPDPNNVIFPQHQTNVDAVIPVFTEDEYMRALDHAKFFVIRSSNADNITMSRTHSEWATTKSNQHHLQNAFSSADFVFLIFTISKTKFFQGVALMTSGISNKVATYWITNESIKLGGCFKIWWISTKELNFVRASHINNVENESVTKSRDCTEIERESGKELCRMFTLPFRDPATPSPLPPSFTKVFHFVPPKIEPKIRQNVIKSVEIEKGKEVIESSKKVENEGNVGSTVKAITGDKKEQEIVLSEKELAVQLCQKTQNQLLSSVLNVFLKNEKVDNDKLKKIMSLLNSREKETDEQTNKTDRDRKNEKSRDRHSSKIKKSRRKDSSDSSRNLRYDSDDSDGNSSRSSDYRKKGRDGKHKNKTHRSSRK